MLFRFLWLDYSCRCYYFEVVEAVRRILLTAGISVISPGSATQINCGYVVATFFAVVYISFKPFVNKADNVLAITAQLATAVTLYVILLLKIELVGYLAANIFLISLAALPFSIALLTVRHTLSNSASPSKTKPVSDDVATSEMNLNSKSETTIKHFPDSESDEPINDDETTTCEVAVGQEPGALGVEIDTVTSEDRAS